jgi:hypothetical protein
MASTSTQKPLYLTPQVFMSARDDYVVLFDTCTGKYLALNSRQSRQLAGVIDGWPYRADDGRPSEGAAPPNPDNPSSAGSIVNSLLKRGLLTEDPSAGKSAAPTEGHAATESFSIFPLERSLRPYLRYLPGFLLACFRAKMLHRAMRLPLLVARLQERRRRWGNQRPDEEKLRTLVRAHHHLRPLVYSWRDQCLLDSMVLLEFLALHRADATWVFGIHTWPWIPHCWVRRGNYLLNEFPWRVGRYSVLAEF